MKIFFSFFHKKAQQNPRQKKLLFQPPPPPSPKEKRNNNKEQQLAFINIINTKLRRRCRCLYQHKLFYFVASRSVCFQLPYVLLLQSEVTALF
jgi:hypothetical protein